MTRRPFLSLVGVAAVTAFAVFIVLVGFSQRHHAPPRGDDAVDRFLAAWRHSRTGTYVVDTTFTRRALNGSEINYFGRTAQRPPERLVLATDGSATLLRPGEVVTCTASPGSKHLQCLSSPTTESYNENVDAELADLEPYVRGTQPLYSVEIDEGGCFVLGRLRFAPTSPYGESATFCFDKKTGAPLSIRVNQGGVVDTTRAHDLRTTVTDRDLQPI